MKITDSCFLVLLSASILFDKILLTHTHTITHVQRHYQWNSYDTDGERWALVTLTKAWPPLMDSNNYSKWLPWFQPQHLGQRRPPTVSVVLYSAATPSSLHTYIKSRSKAFCDVAQLRENNEDEVGSGKERGRSWWSLENWFENQGGQLG